MSLLVEAAVASLEEARRAEAAGAGRLELACFDVPGGVTPDPRVLHAVLGGNPLPTMVLIRPRGGDFCYTPAELRVMEAQIDLARRAGAAGVVLGALDRTGRVDRMATLRLLARAHPLPVTFHRAVDGAPDPVEAVGVLVELGVTRVLTSGGARTALEGAAVIRRMVTGAGERLVVMAGGGVRAGHVSQLVARTGVREVHAREVDGLAAARPAPALDAAQDPG